MTLQEWLVFNEELCRRTKRQGRRFYNQGAEEALSVSLPTAVKIIRSLIYESPNVPTAWMVGKAERIINEAEGKEPEYVKETQPRHETD